ncbi:TFIIB-type zinc ribbon-containing protein [Gymnodinialimonas sp.]
MQCPIDGTTLVMSDRQGVEIDYCPSCRGVWLDRGELDKIIERSVPSAAAPAPEPRESYEDARAPRRKKRGSFLDDIFDF